MNRFSSRYHLPGSLCTTLRVRTAKGTETDLPIVTKDDNTDVVGLQVESHTLDSRLELDHLTSLDLGETEDSGDTITDRDDGSELLQVVLQKRTRVSVGEEKALWLPPKMAASYLATAIAVWNRRLQMLSLLTTWLIPETLDWRIVTASPIEGFLALATAEARNARVCRELSDWYWPTLEITLENILL